MTALTLTIPHAAQDRDVVHVSVFGVPWPAHKLLAVIGAVIVAVMVVSFTGSGAAAMWASGGTLLTIWWGGYRVLRRRWDDVERDFFAENRSVR